VQYPNYAGRDSFTDKVKINLDVFGMLVLNQICREIHHTDIVTINDSGVLEGNM
jgi:hypothetical protein